MIINSMTAKLPQKRYFRQRAHCNPFSDHQIEYPISPDQMDWSIHFPNGQSPEFADIGCGFGGLLVSLAPLFPNINILGMEIRVKVTEYVRQRISALRESQEQSHSYSNISIVRTNSMKCMPHFFSKSQLSKMFFLFPDPHFKKKKHKARIITSTLLSEYAYYLKQDGMLYIATDVSELYDWMFDKLSQHPLFEHVPTEEYNQDPIVQHVLYSTEEGKKVTREKRQRFMAIFKRINLE